MEGKMDRRVKVLDCSVRDGGLMNRWQFDPEFVRQSVAASVLAGVDYLELGYQASTRHFDPAEYGAWRFCPEALLREFWGEEKLRGERNTRLAVMVDIGRCDLSDLPPAAESVISAYRVACYTHQVDEAIALSRGLDAKGYESFINIMAASEADQAELGAALLRVGRESPVRALYLVDSYGNLNPDLTRRLVRWYREMGGGKAIGFHGHNNQQLALANSLAAIEAGADFVDASLYGMGRGAGNCPLELLLAQLGWAVGDLAPLFEVMDRHVVALKDSLRWGYSLPYALAGMANQHPRRAMAIMDEGQGVLESGYLAELAGMAGK